ncbi:prolyl 4-hydroxylase subunit alpha-1-like [Pecten maximus]|uniref:prolyl 4-hydroxylase subunit alpha-1-like n=1 Tax=Pecten maximus TaxID=6579 RepID=UPI001458BCA3|nr:prolyl 4-hydroxylase subunit alpha-1-like [Pecten maximus]
MATREILIQICLVITFIHCVDSQAFSSIRNLEIIYAEEGKLLEALRDFVNRSTKEGLSVADNITSFLNNVEESRSHVQDVEQWMGTPINALNFVCRVVTRWEKTMASLGCDAYRETEAFQDLTRVWTAAKKNTNYWPTLLDKQQIYKSILRLWKMYDLNHVDILSGKIGKSQTEPLSSSQVIEMVKYSKYGNMVYNGVVLIQALHDRRMNTKLDIDNSVSEQELDIELASAYADYRYPEKVIDIMSKYEDSDERLVQLRYNNLVRRAYELPVRHRRNEVTPPKRNWAKDRIQHKLLCNGDMRRAVESPSMKCLYRNTRMKYYTVKEEIVHENPRISIFYDLISEQEIWQLRNLADNQMKQSVSSEEDRNWAKHRVSQSAWKAGSEDSLLAKLNRRIHLTTGFKTGHGDASSQMDQYEITNYGVGGMYESHFDCRSKSTWVNIEQVPETYRKQVNTETDRMATWMFYLSSVEEGGATVFPRLGVRVPVTKGVALFWSNMDKTGSVDERLLNAECPVIHGSKWTAKKWISYEENFPASSRTS